MKQGKKLIGGFGFLILVVFLMSGTAFSWPVPDSGQTKCYNNTEEVPCPIPGENFYGQDASYNINSMSYTKLDVTGNDLPGNASEWVMVRDNVTGLIWEVKTDDGSVHDKDNKYTWYDSNPATNGGYAGTPGNGTDTEDFINALNTANYGGFDDWRIPTRKELRSIVDYSISYPGPVINTAYFPNTAASYYWSSTTYARNAGYAWGMYFHYGVDYDYLKSGNDYVRAVRDGQSVLFDNLIISVPAGFEGPAGSVITVPLTLTNTQAVDLEGIDIILTFDASILTATGATLTGGILESQNYTIQVGTSTNGQVSLAIFANSALFSGQGVLCYVNFQAVGNVDDVSNLTFATAQINESNVTAQNGSVKIIQSTFDISGIVNFFSNNNPVPDVILDLTPDLIGQGSYQDLAGEVGDYFIAGISSGDYTLSPSKTNDLGGLSATDASRIARHVVGLYTFSCMEKIAADVTLNGDISATDASRVARYAVGQISCLNDVNNCRDWVFTPQIIASCSTWPPIAYDFERDYSPLSANQTNQDFVAVRLGDVTGNWTPDSAVAAVQAIQTIKAPAAAVFDASCDKFVSVNDTLSIPIVLDANTLIEGLDIKVIFDETILDAVSATLAGGILDGQNYSLQPNLDNDGEISLAIFANSDLFEGSGNVVFLEFDVVGDSGSTDLAFTKFYVNEAPLTGKFRLDANLCETLHFTVGVAPITGTVTGKVSTQLFEQNVDVIGATVTIAGTQISTVTDASGNYTLTDVPPGTHDLEIIMDHFTPVTVSGVTVTAGENTPVPTDDTILTLSYGCSQTELDAAILAERQKWDANGDGKIGLEEAIRALQVISGID
ncbi:DUF1566 domain-containing protein [bacterium]|nr:DUF1566 domain-containing protein [bacterium]